MSEATEQILQAARERIAVLDTELTGLDIQIQKIENEDKTPRLEERKQLETVIATFEGKKKSSRGRPKRDKTDRFKEVLADGPLTTEEIAERLGIRTKIAEATLTNGGPWVFTQQNGNTVWALANG